MILRSIAATLLAVALLHQAAPAAAAWAASRAGHGARISGVQGSGHGDHRGGHGAARHHPGCPWKRPTGPCPHEAGGGAAISACADRAYAAPAASAAPAVVGATVLLSEPRVLSRRDAAPAPAGADTRAIAPDLPPPRASCR